MIFFSQFKCRKELILFVYIFTPPLKKKWVSSQAHFRSHDQLMIMIMSCSSMTPTWKIPSCDIVTLSSNHIENWYSLLWKGLHIKASMLLKGLSLFEIHSNWSQACLILYVWSILQNLWIKVEICRAIFLLRKYHSQPRILIFLHYFDAVNA